MKINYKNYNFLNNNKNLCNKNCVLLILAQKTKKVVINQKINHSVAEKKVWINQIYSLIEKINLYLNSFNFLD